MGAGARGFRSRKPVVVEDGLLDHVLHGLCDGDKTLNHFISIKINLTLFRLRLFSNIIIISQEKSTARKRRFLKILGYF